MKRRTALMAALIVSGTLVLPVYAAPPEGKGASSNGGNAGPGNSGKGNSGKGNLGSKGNSPAQHRSDKENAHTVRADGRDDHDGDRGISGSRRDKGDARGDYDDRGRYYDYFDNNRDDRGSQRRRDSLNDLVFAGITAALAREYALDYGLRGYSDLPPGIRKNLARGKPLPPGIAKKMPRGFLDRLPRHPGYEWRIAGTDLILISVATAVIADILYDVFD